MDQLKEGVTAKLRSGGPIMTVGEKSSIEGKFLCKWFNKENELKTAWFHENELSLED